MAPQQSIPHSAQVLTIKTGKRDMMIDMPDLFSPEKGLADPRLIRSEMTRPTCWNIHRPPSHCSVQYIDVCLAVSKRKELIVHCSSLHILLRHRVVKWLEVEFSPHIQSRKRPFCILF